MQKTLKEDAERLKQQLDKLNPDSDDSLEKHISTVKTYLTRLQVFAVEVYIYIFLSCKMYTKYLHTKNEFKSLKIYDNLIF